MRRLAVTPDFARQVASDLFGVPGRCQKLDGEVDGNFKIVADGEAFILKVVQGNDAVASAELQTSALQYLSEVSPHLPSPRIKLSKGESPFVRMDLGRDEECCIWMMTFLPGPPARRIAPSRALRTSIVQACCRLSRALSGFRHPRLARETLWDITDIERKLRFAHLVQDRDICDLIDRSSEAVVSHLSKRLPDVRCQALHGDLNMDNILVAPDGETVSGIIDLGEMHYGPHIVDLAILSAFVVGADRASFGHFGDLIATYHRQCPLADTEMPVLVDLVAARCLTVLLVSAHLSFENPENSRYFTKSVPLALSALKKLHGRRSEAIDVVREACRQRQAHGLG